MKRDAGNERIKREYFRWLREADRRDVASVDQAAAAIDRFDAYNGRRSFKRFHIDQAIGFKRQLEGQVSQRTGKPLSKATLHATLAALKAFFRWLAWQPGYKSRLKVTDADYFSLSDKDARVAKARREPQGPTLEQIRRVLEVMPTETAIQRRDRAVVAFGILSGCRDSAAASLKLKHVDPALRRIDQDAREVRTKNRKSFVSHFFPVGDDIEEIVRDWIEELRGVHLWGGDDPLFPKTAVGLGAGRQFTPIGFLREHWSTAAPIRDIFRHAFAAADLPYFHPHSFRHTLVQLAYQLRLDPEQMRVWSLNLGHEHVMTTIGSYGHVPLDRQGEVMAALGRGKEDDVETREMMQRIEEVIRRRRT